MASSFVVTDLMREVAAELDGRGVCSGCDYYVRGMPTEWMLTDGAVGLSFDGVTFSVELRGPVTRRVLDTTNFDVARTAFVSAAVAARHRPDRQLGGPAPRTRAPGAAGAARARTVANVFGALVGGFVGGLLCGLIFPIVIAIAAFLEGPNGNNYAIDGGMSRSATPWRKRPFPPSRIGFWLGFATGVVGCVATAAWWRLHR